MKSADSQTPVARTAPSLNRGTAFTHDERRTLGLTGRLPSAVLNLDDPYDHLLHRIDNTASGLPCEGRLCPRESVLRLPGVW
jgi:hypothetical protein